VYLAAETAVSVLGITPVSDKSLADRSVANEGGVILQTRKQFVTDYSKLCQKCQGCKSIMKSSRRCFPLSIKKKSHALEDK